MTTNCPNCGAPIDRSRDSCEYCGTPYEKEVYVVEAPSLHIDYQLPQFSDDGYKAFLESLSKRSSNGWLRDHGQIYQNTYASQQQLLSNVVGTIAWKPAPEEERKTIDDMRNNVAPIIFPKVEEECANLIDKIRYERRKELLHDILDLLILLGPTIITSVITWFLIH